MEISVVNARESEDSKALREMMEAAWYDGNDAQTYSSLLYSLHSFGFSSKRSFCLSSRSAVKPLRGTRSNAKRNDTSYGRWGCTWEAFYQQSLQLREIDITTADSSNCLRTRSVHIRVNWAASFTIKAWKTIPLASEVTCRKLTHANSVKQLR